MNTASPRTGTIDLQYLAAIACGVLAALALHILLTVLGFGLGTVLKDLYPTNTQQLTSALAWWAIGAAGFFGGWASANYLTAATRGREFIATLARRFLIAVVLAVCTAAGILSKTDGLGGGMNVLTSLVVLGLALLSSYCGARFAYLKTAA
jgi:hypothetical protein